jgi:hypothetical protein
LTGHRPLGCRRERASQPNSPHRIGAEFMACAVEERAPWSSADARQHVVQVAGKLGQLGGPCTDRRLRRAIDNAPASETIERIGRSAAPTINQAAPMTLRQTRAARPSASASDAAHAAPSSDDPTTTMTRSFPRRLNLPADAPARGGTARRR